MQQAGTQITLGLGRYTLRQRLASSAYGEVWRADGPHSARAVAVKLINEEHMARVRPDQGQRWVASATQEIAFLRALAPWDLRHIVRLIDHGQHQGLPVMALELLDADLAGHVAAERRAGRPIGLARSLRWIAQLNQALAKVHQCGWRYLDLKPSNVLLDQGLGRVKLADFGTNRPLRDAGAHAYAGTPNWQAPEQFFGLADDACHTSALTDYFALGVLFYYLVCDGALLRYCEQCGAAYRNYASGAAIVLRKRYHGSLPTTLHPDEEQRFADCVERHGTSADTALALLRMLLASAPGERPAHALDISRAIDAIGAPFTIAHWPGAANQAGGRAA